MPVLLGASFIDGEGTTTNSALLVSSDGKLLGNYAKRKILPIGERPIKWGPLDISSGVNYRAGDGPSDMSVKDWRLQIGICVEDTMRDLVARDVAENSPDLLVSLASDAWFRGIAAAELHFELSKLRAIESGLPLLRVTNRGVSALIDPVGRTQFRLPAAKAAVGVVEPQSIKPAVYSLPWDHRYSSALLLLLFLFIRLLPDRDA